MNPRWADADPRALTYPPGDPSAWYHLAGSEEVGVGVPLAVDVLGEHLVLFRRPDGSATALEGYCPHLGADLAGGTVHDGEISCPFHGWRFGADGRLRAAPASGKVPRAACVRAWEVVEVGNMVFGWRPHGGGPGTPAWADPVGGAMTGLRVVGHHEEEVSVHILEMVENSVDNQHFLPLHSQMRVPWTKLVVPGVTIRHATNWERDPDRDWVVRFTDDAVLAWGGTPIPRTGAHATVSFVGPGAVVRIDFTIPDVGSVCLIQTQTPLSAMRQRVGFTWFAGEGVPGLLASYVVGSWYSQWLADVAIWEHKIYLPRPQLVAADGPVHELRRWYRRFYEGSDRPAVGNRRVG